MFELLLMRHAKSDWHSHLTDKERPLNERGRHDAVRMGSHIEASAIAPDRMVISAARRTQETAELLLQSVSVPASDLFVDDELYLAGTETLCAIIEAYALEDQRLLILAHNPGMDHLVSYLADTAPALSDSGKLMTTCAVAHFSMESLDALKKPGKAKLINLIRPKEISGA